MFNIISYIIVIGIIVSGLTLLVKFFFGNFHISDIQDIKKKEINIEDIDNKVFQIEAHIKVLFETLKDHCRDFNKIKLTLEEHETLLLDYNKINDMSKRLTELEKIIKQGE